LSGAVKTPKAKVGMICSNQKALRDMTKENHVNHNVSKQHMLTILCQNNTWLLLRKLQHEL